MTPIFKSLIAVGSARLGTANGVKLIKPLLTSSIAMLVSLCFLSFISILAFLACGLGFYMASRLMHYEANEQLRITSPPPRGTSK